MNRFLVSLSLMLFVIHVLIPSRALFSEEIEDWIRFNTGRDTEETSIVLVIYRQLIRTDHSQKLAALRRLENFMENSTLSEYKTETVLVLEKAVFEGTRTIHRRNGQVVGDYPDIRIHAARLLGDLGGEHARRVLLEVIGIDNNPDVLAEAVYSIGRIDVVRDVGLLNRLTQLNNTNNTRYRSSRLAHSILDVVSEFHRKEQITNVDLFLSLVETSRGPFSYEVKLKAREVVNAIRH
jgi:hypothetical protein